jgi:hypothetical protein
VTDVNVVVNAATRLSGESEEALELLIGMREKAIKKDPTLKDNVDSNQSTRSR